MKTLRKVVVAGIAACAMLTAASALADGGAPWTEELDGSWRSGVIDHGESSSKEVFVVGPCAATFQWKVSSEQGYDWLRCTVDADYVSEISGETDWANVTFELGAGEHTIRWIYSKDEIETSGEDCGWVTGFAYGEACSIALDANGGYLPDGDAVVRVSGAPIGKLPVPSKLDCEFDGWFTEGGEAVPTDTIASEGLKFVAHWKTASLNWYYDENADGTLTITGVDTAATAFTIPSEIDGMKVTAIGEGAFRGMALTEVVIPASVTEIGDYAFGYCGNLVSVTLNEGLDGIGDYAFSGTALTEVVIPATVRSIGDYAFAYCDGLMTVAVPETLNSVPSRPSNVFTGNPTEVKFYPVNTVTTVWSANGGTFMDGAEDCTNNVVVGAHVQFYKPSPVRDGMYVAGWFTDRDGAGERVTKGTIAREGEDMAFYAFWQPQPFDATSKNAPWTVDEDGTCRSYIHPTPPFTPGHVPSYDPVNAESTMDKFVVGPAAVSFNMRTCENSDESLHFVVDGDYESEVLVAQYNSDWTNVTFRIEDNDEHVLSWIYRRSSMGYWYGYGEVADLVVRTTSVLTFDAGEGVLADGEATREVRIGAAIGELPVPTRDGYTFLGWVDADGEPVTADAVMYFDDVTVTAVWELTTYTLTFDLAGGVFAEGVETTLMLAPGAAYGELPVPTREGYTFLGWFDADGNPVTADTLMGEADVTVTARWEEIKPETPDNPGAVTYTITFDLAGGAFAEGVGTTLTLAPGATVTIPSNPVREGYVFLGWDREIPGVMPSENMTFTAIWGKIATAVTVNLGTGGTVIAIPDDVSLVAGEAIGDANLDKLTNAVVAASAPRHGRRLSGLNDGTGYVTASTVVRDGMSLSAVWETFNPLYEDDSGVVDTTSAQTYDGYILDKNGDDVGSILVKVGKPGKKDGLAQVSATVQLVGTTKKLTFKAKDKGKTKIQETGATYGVELVAKDYAPITVDIAENGLTGVWGDYEIYGARNVSKKKTAASVAYANWSRTVNVAFRTVGATGDGASFAWGRSTLSVAVAANGKVKITGTMSDGSRVNVSSQLLIAESGEEACVNATIPLYSKKGGFGFVLWLAKDGTATVESVSEWYANSKTPFTATLEPLAAGAIGAADSKLVFALVDAPAALNGATVVAAASDGTSLLPDGVEVKFAGGKVVVAKSGKVAVGKDGTIAVTGENAAGLKLKYTAKTGALKGSFTLFTKSGAKVKKVSVSLSGTIVGGKGYGTATVKKVGSFGFELK